MVDTDKILKALVNLGGFLKGEIQGSENNVNNWQRKLNQVIGLAESQNGWFTKENVKFALNEWSVVLNEEKLRSWLKTYRTNKGVTFKTIAIIMAGNIPLVGFHDFISVLLSGNKVLAKLSSNDKVLLPFMAEFLIREYPELKDYIEFTQGKLENFDGVIATGSNNTSRYFEYYFGKYPSIIRKNRSSVAILTGNESKDQLKNLGEDIFRYFGLGCRSVSKLFVPKDYDFKLFFEAVYDWKGIINNHKYCNNYDYNKAVFLMSDFTILDNGFLLVKEDNGFASPIGTLYFEYYSDKQSLKDQLKDRESELQCVVSNGFKENEVTFGTTQQPKLSDYADGIDTLDFLFNI